MARWIIGILALVAAVLAGLFWAGLRLSPLAFYSYDGAAAIERAKAFNVEILREAYGVPHVVGRTDADAAFGAAFAHAEDDFSTLETALYAARGRAMTARTKEDAITSYLVQHFRIHDLVENRYEQDLSPEVRAMAEAYADGLNYYAALNPNEITTDLFPVTGRDITALVSFSSPLFYGMTGTLTELLNPQAERKASEGQAIQVTLLGINSQTEIGSNGLAVAAPRSEDGVTRLYVNSHQPTDGPLAWYEIRMKSDEGLNFAGGTFPGSPLPFHGHNADLGWTSTVNRPDLIDLYALTINPDNDNQYRLDGEWVDFDRTEAVMTVHLWGPFSWRVTRPSLRSAHGPVFETPSGFVAVLYATMDSAGFLEEQYRLVKARNLEEFRDALRLNEQGNINRIYADKTGHLAMFYVARMPRRVPGFDYKGTLPGDRSDLIWSDFVPFDDLPHVIDPPEGFITEANSTPFIVTGGPTDPKAEDYPAEHGIETRVTNRSLQALALFQADTSISRDDLTAIKFDHGYHPDSLTAQVLRDMLGLDPGSDETLKAAQDHLRAWDFRADADNPHAALALLATTPAAIDRDNGRPDPDLTDELRKAAALLTAQFGRLDVPWGEVNRLMRGDKDWPLSGGPDTLRAVYGEEEPDGRLRMVAGDGLIMLVEWAPGGMLTSHSIHHYGSATGRPASPHYADQAPLFAAEELTPVPFSKQALASATVERYRPGQRNQ